MRVREILQAEGRHVQRPWGGNELGVWEEPREAGLALEK